MRSIAGALSRHATPIMALAVFAGVAIPAFSALLGPFVLAASMGTIYVTIVRLDARRLVGHLRRPLLSLALLVWTLIVLPLAVLALAKSMPIAAWLAAGVVLMAATPTILSVGAYSVFLGTDSELLLTVSVPATALSIITLPLFAGAVGVEGVAPAALALKLFLVVGIAFGGAMVTRLVVSEARLERNALWLDALMVLLIVVVGAGVTDGLQATLIAQPALAIQSFLVTLALNIALQAASWIAFLRSKTVIAGSAALAGGCRNMALLIGLVLGQVGPELQLFLVMGQIQLFQLPALMRPIYARLGVAATSG
ncbi:MAG: hypothetical protein ABIU95_09215 [Burkholderiales bacterium]